MGQSLVSAKTATLLLLLAMPGMSYATSIPIGGTPDVKLPSGYSMELLGGGKGKLKGANGRAFAIYDMNTQTFTQAIGDGGSTHAPSALEQTQFKILITGGDFSAYTTKEPQVTSSGDKTATAGTSDPQKNTTENVTSTKPVAGETIVSRFRDVPRTTIDKHSYLDVTSTGRIMLITGKVGEEAGVTVAPDALNHPSYQGEEFARFNEKGDLVGTDGKPLDNERLAEVLGGLASQHIDKTSMTFESGYAEMLMPNGYTMNFYLFPNSETQAVLVDQNRRPVARYDVQTNRFISTMGLEGTRTVEYIVSDADKARFQELIKGADFSAYKRPNDRYGRQPLDIQALTQATFDQLFPTGLAGNSTDKYTDKNTFTITLPSEGVKQLDNGYTVDKDGIIKNKYGTVIAVLNDKGQFLDPFTKKPVATQQSAEWFAAIWSGKPTSSGNECRVADTAATSAARPVSDYAGTQKNGFVAETYNGEIYEGSPR